MPTDVKCCHTTVSLQVITAHLFTTHRLRQSQFSKHYKHLEAQQMHISDCPPNQKHKKLITYKLQPRSTDIL